MVLAVMQVAQTDNKLGVMQSQNVDMCWISVGWLFPRM